jgi:hypothetical protein
MAVSSGTGAALLGGVSLAAGNVDQFTVAIDPDTVNEEIVFVTANSGDTFTIVRGRAGSTAITHASGATVRHVLTSDDLNFFKTAIQPTTLTAKGDTFVATSSGVVTNLAVGTDGQVLTADSTAAKGLKWSTSATGDVTLTGVQTLTNKTLTSPVLNDPKLNLSINTNTATTYTFVLTDNGKLVTSNNAAAQTLSIPTNASVAFPIGTQINVAWITGAGQPTINAVTSGTTTILSTAATSAAPKLRVVNSVATCVKIATDTWLVTGDLA